MRKILALAILVVLVVSGWTAGWFWLAGEARSQIEMLAAADGETAPRLTCGEISTSGFPFRVDLECRNVELRDRDMTYRLDALRAAVLVYRPTHVILSAHGPVTTADAFTGSTARIEFASLEASARVTSRDFWQGWRIARISMVADELAWFDTTTGDVPRGNADHAELHLQDMPELHDRVAGEAGLAVFAETRGLDLPLLTIADGNLTAELELTHLPDTLEVLVADPEPLRSWQARGGELRIVRLAGDQPNPDEDFEITGNLHLDAAGRAEGELNYSVRNVLDRLAGTIPPLELAAFKGLPQGEGRFGNTLAVTGGAVRLLTFTLMEIPPLF